MRNQTAPSLANATAVRPQTQVEGMLNAVGAAIEILDKAIDNHREKISPVVRQDTPASESKPGAPEEILVPVADRLRTFQRRIDGLRIQLESLTERVEA